MTITTVEGIRNDASALTFLNTVALQQKLVEWLSMRQYSPSLMETSQTT